MMTLKTTSALGAALLVGLASGCASTSAGGCGPSTCGGCCDANGFCRSGIETLQCGTNGAACVACPEGASCGAGVCSPPDAGTANCQTGLPGPSGRSDFAGAVDADHRRLVLFGGDPGFGANCTPAGTFDGETWLYDLDCNSWSKFQGAGPSPRSRHVGAWDSARNRLLIFGGRYRAGASGAYTLYNETWAFDPAGDGGAGQWAQLQPTGTLPPGLANAAAAYDASGDRLLVFGGNTSTSGLTFSPEARLWALDLAANRWDEVLPSTAARPPARLFHGLALDVQRHRLLVFSGGDQNAFTGPFLSDLWSFDLSTRTWAALSPRGALPANRIRPSLVLDAARDRLLLFGGHDDQALGERNDLSALALSSPAWSTVRAGDTLDQPGTGFCAFPANFTHADLESPERREAQLLTAASADIYYLVGGRSDCGVLADVWRFDAALGSWHELKPAFSGVSCARSGKTDCTSLCF